MSNNFLSNSTKQLDENRIKVVEAATSLLMRYGFKRVTMGDLAGELGVSRQTLYASYANKDLVLVEVIRSSFERTFANISKDWETTEGLSEHLDAYFNHAVMAYYDMIAAAPDSEDIDSGFNDAGREELKRCCGELETMLLGLFSPLEEKLIANKTTPAALANYVSVSGLQMKKAANDRDHLSALLQTLKVSVLALADQ